MANNIWFTSDTHFRHSNIIGYCGRPFSSVEEMDETLIENWNSVVKEGDKIYHLGDVYMPKGYKKNDEDSLFKKLNGTKILILGNHDLGKDQLLLKYFKRIHAYRILKEHGIMLSHVPVHFDSINKKVKINVHGHTHDRGSPIGPYKSVCVELTNYKPIHLDEIKC